MLKLDKGRDETLEKPFQCYADSSYIIDLNDVIFAQNEQAAKDKFKSILDENELNYGDIHVWELKKAL